MKKLIGFLFALLIIVSCESFKTPTRPVYPMPFSMAIGNWWEYLNDSPVGYVLQVIDSVTCNELPAAYIMKFSNENNPQTEFFYWVWNNERKTLFEYDHAMQPRFALGYSGKGHTIQWGLCQSILLDNNCFPYLNGGQCHTHLNCREHLLIVSATGDSGNVITDPQIGFFWRFDCGELVDWGVK